MGSRMDAIHEELEKKESGSVSDIKASQEDIVLGDLGKSTGVKRSEISPFKAGGSDEIPVPEQGNNKAAKTESETISKELSY